MIEVPAAITISGIFRLRRQRRRRQRGRRDAEAGDEIDLVVDDQFLGEALGVVGNRGVILQDDLDLLAGDGVALLLHVELDGVVDLLAGRGLAAGHRQDQADLDGVFGARRRKRHDARNSSQCRRTRQQFGSKSDMNGISPDRSCASNRVPGPCLTIAQIFRPCSGATRRRRVPCCQPAEGCGSAAKSRYDANRRQAVSGAMIPHAAGYRETSNHLP